MKIRYGLIGLGNISENRIIKEGFSFDRKRFQPSDTIELIGATDINLKCRRKTDSFGITWFNTSEELLKIKDIDAVIIATENASHYPLAKAAMESGKHCLVEKPMSVTLEEVLDLKKTAGLNNVSLSVNHVMKHNAYNILSQRLLADGRIGKINSITLHMEIEYGAKKNEAASWRCSNPAILGGPLGDLGSHCFYMAEFLLHSKIRELASIYYPKTLDIAVENGVYVSFKTESNIEGTIRVSFASPRGGLFSSIQSLGYEAYGEEGTLRSYATMYQLSGHEDEPVPVRVEVEDGKGVERYDMPRENIKNIYQSSILEHATSIILKDHLDGTEGVRNILLIEKAHESARENGSKKWI
jgi:predicted dehydrogenase